MAGQKPRLPNVLTNAVSCPRCRELDPAAEVAIARDLDSNQIRCALGLHTFDEVPEEKTPENDGAKTAVLGDTSTPAEAPPPGESQSGITPLPVGVGGLGWSRQPSGDVVVCLSVPAAATPSRWKLRPCGGRLPLAPKADPRLDGGLTLSPPAPLWAQQRCPPCGEWPAVPRVRQTQSRKDSGLCPCSQGQNRPSSAHRPRHKH
jgi:hypothetical protein